MENITIETSKILEAMSMAQENMKISKYKLKDSEQYLHEINESLYELEMLTQQHKEVLNLYTCTKDFVNENATELRKTAQSVCNCINQVYEDIKIQGQQYLTLEQHYIETENNYIELNKLGNSELACLSTLKQDFKEKYTVEMARKKSELKQTIDENFILQDELNKRNLEFMKLQTRFDKDIDNNCLCIESLQNEIKLIKIQYGAIKKEEENLINFDEDEKKNIQKIIEETESDSVIINDEINDTEMETLILTKTINETSIYKENLMKKNEQLKENKENLMGNCCDLKKSIEGIEEEIKKSEKLMINDLDVKISSIKSNQYKSATEKEITSKLNADVIQTKLQIEAMDDEINKHKTKEQKMTNLRDEIWKCIRELNDDNESCKVMIEKLVKELGIVEKKLKEKAEKWEKSKSVHKENLLELNENQNLKRKEFDEEYENIRKETKSVEDYNVIRQQNLVLIQSQLKQLDINRNDANARKNQNLELNELLTIQCDNLTLELTKLIKMKSSGKLMKIKQSHHKFPKPKPLRGIVSSTKSEKRGIEFDSSDMSSVDENAYTNQDFYKMKQFKDAKKIAKNKKVKY